MIKKLVLGSLFLAFNMGAIAADWPADYKRCASDGNNCQVGVTPRAVSYGVKGKWVTKTLSGTIACTVKTFGSDPYPGKSKKCAIGPLKSAPVVSNQAGGAALEKAPHDGWAGEQGGTAGGAMATGENIYTVSSASKLVSVLEAAGDKPKIIKIVGTIDTTSADNGGAFKNATDQKNRIVIRVPSNTTIIGVGADARLMNTSLKISNAESVIVRNLTIVAPCDIKPLWDPNDGAKGNWNSEYDALTIEASRHVWIDHNRFTDTPRTDDQFPVENGKHKQCHDGALDVKTRSDFVTVSYNVFDQHDKNNLIGSSDKDADRARDDGHLTVTFHHNHFTNIVQRAPRVRFGMVHLYNNYYQGDKSANTYAHLYSVGVGYLAKIILENNVFDVMGAKDCGDVIVNAGSSSKTGFITDSGSLVNGMPLDLSGACKFNTAVGWTVPYTSKMGSSLTSAYGVKQAVLSNAGTGKLSVK